MTSDKNIVGGRRHAPEGKKSRELPLPKRKMNSIKKMAGAGGAAVGAVRPQTTARRFEVVRQASKNWATPSSGVLGITP